MKVLITGGRDFKSRRVMREALAELPDDTILCHGASPGGGADWIADDLADVMGFKKKRYPVEQRLDGPWPGAGPRRNQRMLDDFKPDLALAFPGPKSRGTYDMIRRLKAAGVPYRVYHQP